MPGDYKTLVVMPAYNAANTLERCYEDIPKEHVDEIVVVDDCSSDDTCAIAKKLPITLIEHENNTGYGGNQKTCYDYARKVGADFVIMIHADYQYDARMIQPAVDVMRLGICDVVLGNPATLVLPVGDWGVQRLGTDAEGRPIVLLVSARPVR